VAAAECAMFGISIAVERQYGDRFVEWINDPVLGDLRFGVVARFLLDVARGRLGEERSAPPGEWDAWWR